MEYYSFHALFIIATKYSSLSTDADTSYAE